MVTILFCAWKQKSRGKNAQIGMAILGKFIFMPCIDMTEIKHYTYRTSLQYVVAKMFEIQYYV